MNGSSELGGESGEALEAEAIEGEDLGFKDVPLSDFRATREGEFIEPALETYPVEPFGDPQNIVERINPNFEAGAEPYRNNCADCARSFERTWRGNREEAAGRAPQETSPGVYEVEGETSLVTEQWAGESFRDVYRVEDLHAAIDRSGHGSSAIVHSIWADENGGFAGHAYNVVNHEGTLKVCDGQIGRTYEWSALSVHPELDGDARHTAIAWGPKGERIW
jgi:hypothetical protein